MIRKEIEYHTFKHKGDMILMWMKPLGGYVFEQLFIKDKTLDGVKSKFIKQLDKHNFRHPKSLNKLGK